MVRRKYFGNYGNPNMFINIYYTYVVKKLHLMSKKTYNRYKKTGLKPVFTHINFHSSR